MHFILAGFVFIFYTSIRQLSTKVQMIVVKVFIGSLRARFGSHFVKLDGYTLYKNLPENFPVSHNPRPISCCKLENMGDHELFLFGVCIWGVGWWYFWDHLRTNGAAQRGAKCTHIFWKTAIFFFLRLSYFQKTAPAEPFQKSQDKKSIRAELSKLHGCFCTNNRLANTCQYAFLIFLHHLLLYEGWEHVASEPIDFEEIDKILKTWFFGFRCLVLRETRVCWKMVVML